MKFRRLGKFTSKLEICAQDNCDVRTDVGGMQPTKDVYNGEGYRRVWTTKTVVKFLPELCGRHKRTVPYQGSQFDL